MRSLFYFSILPSACALLAAQVAVKDDGKAFTLSNGYVTAMIGYADGKPMSGMICDLEIRHSMGRGDKGIYTYAVFSHPAGYGETQVGESRFGAKLNGAVLDLISIDESRNGYMPTGPDWDHGTPLNARETRRLTTGRFAGRAGTVTGFAYDATINRDRIAGGWVEKDLVFDAGLFKAGENVMTLTIPAGGLTSGIIYDSIRLELQ